MDLSSISTHKLSCIFAPIDIPKTAESKQSQIAASEVSDTAICAQEKRIVHKLYTKYTLYTVLTSVNPYFMRVMRATVSTWLVWANISTGWIFSALYPSFSKISISLARVAGLQDT